MNSYSFCHLSKRAIPIVMKYRHPASIVSSFKTLGEKSWVRGVKDVHRLEVGTKEKIRKAVIVVVECNGLDGIHVTVESCGFGDVTEFTIAKIFVQNAVPETHDQQVRSSVIIEVKP